MGYFATSLLLDILLASALQLLLLPPLGCHAISTDHLSTASTGASASSGARAAVLLQHDASLPIPPEYHPDVRTVVQLSWRPRAFLFPGFLSHAECDYVVNYSTPRIERSTVVGSGGSSVVDNIRTSYGCFVDKGATPIIKRIERRVADWTFLPVENQEAMQVLRYRHGQKYGAHHDYYGAKDATPGGPRYATVLMYLSHVKSGGETAFPTSEPDKQMKDSSWSECGKSGVAVKPRKGDALLFFSMNPDASFDTASLHTGCPVIEGEKWSATKWIHVGSFDPPYRDPSICQDDNPSCGDWAKTGECAKNPKFMVGTGTEQSQLGFCRKSCGVCH